MIKRKQQEGMVLLTTMIVMVLTTMICMGMISVSDTDIRMVGNRQSARQAENIAMEVSEGILGNLDNFSSPAALDYSENGYDITVSTTTCLTEAPVSGYSALVPLVPQQTYWEYQVEVTDPISGSKATVYQGVKLKMLAGSCP